jgi:hypothetical protein
MASEAYPTFLAGQRITAALLSSAQPMVARKTADTQRNSTTLATADPHLQFTVEANAVYIMDGFIKFESAANADFAVDWSAPTGAEGEWVGVGAGHSPVIGATTGLVLQGDTQDARGYLIRTESNDLTSARSFGGLGVGLIPISLHLTGTIRVGSSGGIYSFDWAQGSSQATNTTVYTDSWIRLQRVA